MAEIIITGLETVLHNLDARIAALHKGAHTAAEEIAALLETYAKGHHSWKPDTGATDVSTRGEIVQETAELITIVLSAGMDYDIYLELARGGKYAWLWPAIENNRARILEILVKHTGQAWTY
jgi:hypothetical protein